MAEQFDLVITGGRVIDPATGLDGIQDVAIHDGKIAAIGEGLANGSDAIDAAGRLVIPGMIDTHAHVYEYVSGRFGLNPDLVGVAPASRAERPPGVRATAPTRRSGRRHGTARSFTDGPPPAASPTT